MQKALITHATSNRLNDGLVETEVEFPLNRINLDNYNIASIDLAPEEEYFLTSDDDGHDYMIPVHLKDRFNHLLYEASDVEYENDMFNQIFSQYRVEGDWEKTYKIVKR